MQWNDIIVLILSIFMIGSVLLQSSSEDAIEAFSGETSELFKNQKMIGIEKILTLATLVATVLWVVFLFIPSVPKM